MNNYTFLVLVNDGTTQYPQGVVEVRAESYPNAVHKARFVAFLHLKCNPAMLVTDLLMQQEANA